jgi:hypothetical protein
MSYSLTNKTQKMNVQSVQENINSGPGFKPNQIFNVLRSNLRGKIDTIEQAFRPFESGSNKENKPDDLDLTNINSNSKNTTVDSNVISAHFSRNLEKIKYFLSKDIRDKDNLYILFVNEKKLGEEKIVDKEILLSIRSHFHNNMRFRRESELCGLIKDIMPVSGSGEGYIVTINLVYVNKIGKLVTLEEDQTFYINIAITEDVDLSSGLHKVFIQDRLPTPLFNVLDDEEKPYYSKSFKEKDGFDQVKNTTKPSFNFSKIPLEIVDNDSNQEIEFALNDISIVDIPEKSIEANISDAYDFIDMPETFIPIPDEIISSKNTIKMNTTKEQENQQKEGFTRGINSNLTLEFQEYLCKIFPLFLVNKIDKFYLSLFNDSSISIEKIIGLIDFEIEKLNISFKISIQSKNFEDLSELSEYSTSILTYKMLKDFLISKRSS